ncbi:MAG TPA: chloride channel protein [Ilumatobacteraceae bacterium]|nr:chloride channel protein [Ilumatobacteraceae bacterium]HRB02593.1 chloride channel protein [Ilumatobacteraceae bacterium]
MNNPTWIPTHRRDEIKALAARSHQVVTFAAVVGVITGLVVAGFDRLVVDVSLTRVLRLSPWLIAFVPGVGLLVAWAARRFIGGRVSASTTDEYLQSFHNAGYTLGWRPFVARMIAALATLGSGGPMGLEGPSMYSGAVVGSNLQRRFPRVFRDADRRLLLVAGAAAGVAAIFKAPATGAVFAMEVPYQNELARRMLLPALVASASGYLTFVSINGTDPLFHIEGATGFVLRDLFGAVAVGVIAGVGARAFAWMLRHAKVVANGDHPLAAALAAGVVLAGLFGLGRLLIGQSLVFGSGYQVVAWASSPGHTVWILAAMLALRCVGTAVTVAGGGVGGLFIPLVVGGALAGAAIGTAVNQFDLNLFIIIGVAAFLGAGYRVPLAAVVFIAETTGRPTFIVPGLLAAVAAELVMGLSSVTSYQKVTDIIVTTTADDDDDTGPIHIP